MKKKKSAHRVATSFYTLLLVLRGMMSILSSSRERVKSLLVLYHPESEGNLWWKGARLVVSLVVMGFLLWLLFKFTDAPAIFVLVEKASWKTLVLAIVLYAVMISLRAVRVLVFLPRTEFRLGVPLMAVHNMLSNTLPFRVGEWSFVHY